MQTGNSTNNPEMAMRTLLGTKAIGMHYVQKDNTSEDQDPKEGSVHWTSNEDTTSIDAKVNFDPLPDQIGILKDMSLSIKQPGDEMTITYGRIPDSETEMVSTKSTAENKEVSVIVDESKGIYSYNERPLIAE